MKQLFLISITVIQLFASSASTSSSPVYYTSTSGYVTGTYSPASGCREVYESPYAGTNSPVCESPDVMTDTSLYILLGHDYTCEYGRWPDTYNYYGKAYYSLVADSAKQCDSNGMLDMTTCNCIYPSSSTGGNSSGSGNTGSSGSTGNTGSSGSTGNTGSSGSTGSTGNTGGSNSSSGCPALASYQVAWITALIPSAAQCNETDVNPEGSIYVYHNHIWDTCRNQCVSTRYGCSVGLVNDGDGNCASPNLQSGSCSNWVFSYLQGPDSSGSCYNVYECQSDTSVPDDYIQVSCGYEDDGNTDSSTPYASSSGNSDDSQSSNAQSNTVSSNSNSSNIYPVSVASSDSSSNVSDGSTGTGQSSTSQTSSTATGSGSGSSTAQFSSVDFQGVYDRLDHLSDDNDQRLNRLDTLVTNTQNTNTKLDTANGHLLDILDQSKNTVTELKTTNSNLSAANTKLSHIDAKIEESNDYLSEIQSVLENIHDALTATGTSSIGSGTGGSASSQTTTGGNGSASSAVTSTGSGTGSAGSATSQSSAGIGTGGGSATSGSAASGSASSDPFWTDEEYKDDYQDNNQSYVDTATGKFSEFTGFGDLLGLKNIASSCNAPNVTINIGSFGSFQLHINSFLSSLPLTDIQNTLLLVAAISGFIRVFSGGD